MSHAIDKVISELRRPFTPEAVQFKIQSAKSAKALIVCYIDARQTGERLNHVCPEQWADHYREVAVGNKWGVECGISIMGNAGKTLTRTDVGIDEGGIGGLKAVYSDAFKRAGVKWGIGASLYYTPRFFGNKSDLKEVGGKFYMSPKVENDARGQYRKWLDAEGIERFGEPLDMGDPVNAQGDVEVRPDSDPDAPDTGTAPTTRMSAVAELADDFAAYIDSGGDRNKFKVYLNSVGINENLTGLTREQIEGVRAFLKEATG